MINEVLIGEIKEAQKYTNFVILMPTLHETYNFKNITLKKETNKQRSSIRFEIHSKGKVLRIKQFFYDWAIPVITADTNLIQQGKSFEIEGIVGFIGIDYKGNQAACFCRWFTNIELSVIEGTFDEKEILIILEGLKAVDNDSIRTIGEQSFTTCSYTARYNRSKWNTDDEVSRVAWYEANKKIQIEENLGIKIPKNHNEFFLDSIGYKEYESDTEYHFLYRSQEDFTNGFWIWIAPRKFSDPLPQFTGNKIGTRQSWNIKKVSGSILHIPVNEIILCRQNTKYKSWMVHWEKDNYIYHFYSRASIKNNIREFQLFFSALYSQ
ncbi:hypothetical protein [Solibacillus merdavium]|uniref:Uncharacterized protein n=1 Tax=Solibacillus merdavium TaxID=2762218 RepID=A0ABR8XJ53_9BACL|nr:hypothetical protein [Solibacillus merdavium]MBD8031969.1 hypothetical protein [Solibacillus merdavium]